MDTTFPIFHTTISAKELRPDMPPVPFLLFAASFARPDSKGTIRLRRPRYLPASERRGADCGGYTAVMRWGGRYRFTPVQYIEWLYTWQPEWAATLDLPYLSESRDYPGAAVVEARQRFTTEMAWHFWERYRDVPWAWVPSITGYHIEDYERHAHALADLIRQMLVYYSDPGFGDDNWGEGGHAALAWRAGLGSLCRRVSAAFILKVIQRVQTIIGIDVPLHLWGVKLGTLKKGIALPCVVSCDSGTWSGLFGKEHEKRRNSGLTVVEYSWQEKHPDYLRKVAQAQRRPQQLGLVFEEPGRASWFPDSTQLITQLT
jgi:hypothetical protein